MHTLATITRKARWLALVLFVSICGVGLAGCGGTGASMVDGQETTTAPLAS